MCGVQVLPVEQNQILSIQIGLLATQGKDVIALA